MSAKNCLSKYAYCVITSARIFSHTFKTGFVCCCAAVTRILVRSIGEPCMKWSSTFLSCGSAFRAFGVAMLAGIGTAQAANLVVTPTSLQGWSIAPNGTPPSYGFVSGPGTPPAGVGSFQTSITVANSKVILGVPSALVSGANPNSLAITYSTYINPSSTTTNTYYVNVYIDRASNGFGTFSNGFYDCRYDYSFTGNSGAWTAHSISGATVPTNIGGSSCPAAPTLGDSSLAGDRILFVVFNMGDTANSYVGFSGALDNVTVTTNLGSDNFDFEVAQAASTSVSVPTLAFWLQLLLAAVLGIAGIRVVRARA